MAGDTVPFRLRHLDHVVLRARDGDALVRFYREVLGCTLERESAEVGLVQLRAGDALIDIVPVDGRLGRAGGSPPLPRDGHNVDHLCLRVDPFDSAAITAHLKRHGAEPTEVRHVYGAEGFGPSIYVDDPEGNTVELKGPATAADP
jgi:catechol 2,3-dioxygenase-like lactoylglutathione lyase family enzyme